MTWFTRPLKPSTFMDPACRPPAFRVPLRGCSYVFAAAHPGQGEPAPDGGQVGGEEPLDEHGGDTGGEDDRENDPDRGLMVAGARRAWEYTALSACTVGRVERSRGITHCRRPRSRGSP